MKWKQNANSLLDARCMSEVLPNFKLFVDFYQSVEYSRGNESEGEQVSSNIAVMMITERSTTLLAGTASS